MLTGDRVGLWRASLHAELAQVADAVIGHVVEDIGVSMLLPIQLLTSGSGRGS